VAGVWEVRLRLEAAEERRFDHRCERIGCGRQSGLRRGGVLGVCFSSHTSICASPLNSNDIASSFRGAERHRTTLPRTIFLGAKSGGPWSVSVSFSSLR
jgi:hypothetical protein